MPTPPSLPPLSAPERGLGGEVSLSEPGREIFSAVPIGEVSRLASLRADFALYATLIRAQINAQLQYRTSFAFQTISQFIITFTDFIMLRRRSSR